MKVKQLILKNFARFSNFAMEFGDRVTHLVGLNGDGKTTVGCTAIWAGLKGIAEKGDTGVIGDRQLFIGNAGKSADIEIHISDEKTGEIIVCRNHITKDSNKITFTSNKGRQLNDDWLKGLFNSAFMSAKAFCSLSGKAQAIALGIDVSKYDNEIKTLKNDFTIINRELKSFGSFVEPEKVEPVDVDKLTAEKDHIRQRLNKLYLDNVEHNKNLRTKYNADVEAERKTNEEFNKSQVKKTEAKFNCHKAICVLREYGYTGEEAWCWVEKLPEPLTEKIEITTPEPDYITERPDDCELVDIDTKISQASAINSRAAIYTEHLKNKAKKEAKENELADNKAAQDTKEKEKLDYISSFKFGFTGLSVDEDGGLLLNGRPIRDPYYSKGELEMIVAKMASTINSEWKTRFIDDFDLLDEPNQVKLLKDLTDAGYQVITAEVGTVATKDGSIVLIECKIDNGTDAEKVSLF